MSRTTSKDDIRLWFEYSLHLPTRTVYVGDTGEIDTGTDAFMAERVIKALHLLDESSGLISVVMNNAGGSVYDGFAIYDAIRACKNHVEVRVLGSCMSMGMVILQAADTRVMATNARAMIHYGELTFTGHAKDAERWAEESAYLGKRIEEILFHRIRAKKKGFRVDKLRELLTFDTFLSAKECVDLGLADKMLKGA